MLREDNPPLLDADESAYVERLCSHEQSLEEALTLFDVGRRQFARVLRNLPDEAFTRPGTHDRRGTVRRGGHGEGLRRARDIPPAVPAREADPAGEAAAAVVGCLVRGNQTSRPNWTGSPRWPVFD